MIESVTRRIVRVAFEDVEGGMAYQVGEEDPDSHSDAIVEKIRPAYAHDPPPVPQDLKVLPDGEAGELLFVPAPPTIGLLVTFSDGTHRVMPTHRIYWYDLEPEGKPI